VFAVLLALGASLSWGGGDFIGGLTSRRLGSALTVVLLSQFAALTLFCVVVVALRPNLPGSEFLPYAVLAGFIEAVALAALYRGLAVGAMGVVSPIAAGSAIIPVGVGLASGEALTGLQAAGVPLALIGVALVAWTPGEPGAITGRVAAGVGLALLAAAGFGGFLVAIDAAVERADVIWSVFVARVSMVAFVGLAALATRPQLAEAAPLAPALIAAGVLDLGAVTLIAAATTQGLLAVVAVLASLYPIVTVLLARFVLGERLRASQRVGTAVALLGVAMISAGA
jgi:drug/metabolite transporter (DMT)-like permease